MQDIEDIKNKLLSKIALSLSPREILKDSSLKQLYANISNLPIDQRGSYGRLINEFKKDLEELIRKRDLELEDLDVEPIDVTAPFDINTAKPTLFSADIGTQHPLTLELENVIDIFTRMGFEAFESRQIDDDEHMFSTLNFPENHPARDAYDTFRTEEGFIPPAHTSTMQNRILRAGKAKLEAGGNIAAISYGRVFRNEDVDATHEHTFYQCEGVFVSKDATVGQMIGTLQNFIEVYYGQKLKIKTQPAYFPFVEPGLEFVIERPVAIGGKPGEWLEICPCGMIHPNVLKSAGIDSNKYRGFAWGCGIDRLVMLKYGIEDIRHFHAGKLAFARKFI